MFRFFIKRPIVAMVIAILTVIAGAVTIATLPVAQFPNIAPPEIRLQANYPGADAQTLEQAVATPIEEQVNGVGNMNYMCSLNASSNQQTTLFADFDLKTGDDRADRTRAGFCRPSKQRGWVRFVFVRYCWAALTARKLWQTSEHHRLP